MLARRLLVVVSAAVLAGCNCTPSTPPADAGATCDSPMACPEPNNECLVRTCVDRTCGTELVANGTPVSTQTSGDCLSNQCNGQGSVVAVPDATDVADDNNDCTLDTCAASGPVTTNVDAGVACGTGGALQCDGAGQCVGCIAPADCSGQDTECQARTCQAGVCGTSNTTQGTVLTAQTAGDCQQQECDGLGAAVPVALATDLPVDGLECTEDVCTGTVPSNPPRTAGTSCTENSGVSCDGAGACVQCLAASDCGTDTECTAFTCTGGACGQTFTSSGTPVATQTAGDCQQVVCDGSGATTQSADNTDLPVDGFQCTSDVCTSGTPTNPAVTAGTACTEGGGTQCNGAGLCVGCLAAADCGTDTECTTFTCTAGACGQTYTTAGTALSTQTTGDCSTAVCDGSGGTTASVNDADLPVDSFQCTDDMCTSGTPSNPALTAGTTCTEGGGTRCDGAGTCVQCQAASDCGTDTECTTFTCTVGVCGQTYTTAGTALSAQTTGDCRTAVCDGSGGTTASVNDADLPVDGFQCTGDVCTNGTPTNPALVAGTACTEGGGSLCDGAGACVGCTAAADCPGTDTECQTRTCLAGACGFSFASAGTALSTQTTGDCSDAVCDGSGGTTASVNDADLPVDGNQCTADVCTNGTPANPARTVGTVCTQNGGTVCDGAGACVECVGNGDCSSGVCLSNVCQAPTCVDGVKNGAETDNDCGGGTCPACAPAAACLVPTDCQSGVCTGLVCGSPTVANIVPANGATGVALGSSISITFTAAMKPSSLTRQTAAGPCTGSIQVSTDDFLTCLALPTLVLSGGDTVVSMTPALASATRYRVRVTTAAQDAFNNPLGSPFTTPSGFLTAPVGSSCGVVISQVYGGGGNSGSVWTNDFIELRNQGTLPVNLAGWSVQYTSATGAGTWGKTDLTSIVLAPGGYYLVQEAAGTGGTTPLPTPDAIGTLTMSGTAGKVALVSNTTPLSGACPVGVIDMVGFGSAASCFEGTGPTPAPSNTTAVLRAAAGCGESNQNATDFATGMPTPRNTGTAATSCSACGVQNETDAALEADWCNLQFPYSLNVVASSTTPDIFGQLYEVGVTEAAGAPAGVIAQVGYGPVGVNPLTQCGWQFLPASYNIQVGNNDEYRGAFTAPAIAGDYWYTLRFSLDNGASWTFGDMSGAGALAGQTFDTSQLPVMTVVP